MASAKSEHAVAEKLVANLIAFVEACTEVWPTDSVLREALTTLQSLEDSQKIALTKTMTTVFSKSDEDLALAKDASLWNHSALTP